MTAAVAVVGVTMIVSGFPMSIVTVSSFAPFAVVRVFHSSIAVLIAISSMLAVMMVSMSIVSVVVSMVTVAIAVALITITTSGSFNDKLASIGRIVNEMTSWTVWTNTTAVKTSTHFRFVFWMSCQRS